MNTKRHGFIVETKEGWIEYDPVEFPEDALLSHLSYKDWNKMDVDIEDTFISWDDCDTTVDKVEKQKP